MSAACVRPAAGCAIVTCMSALLFPTTDAVRLALTAGVIPPAVARGPVAAGFGDSGELWLVPARPPSAEVLAALARIGVRPHAPPPGFVPTPFPCWAAPLPLRPDPTPPAGPRLVRVPVGRLAGFVAAAQRLRPQAVRFLPDRPFALVHLPHPPAHLLDAPDVVAYHEPAPGVWVPVGWQHPLPAALGVSDGQLAFVDPPAVWTVTPCPPFLDSADTFPLTVRPRPVYGSADPFPSVRVPVKLRKHPADTPEVLWAFDGSPAELADLFRSTDERVLSKCTFAVVEAGGTRRVWAKATSRGKVPVLPSPFRGFVPHPMLTGVFLPAGYSLAPSPRADRLTGLVHASPTHLVCVEAECGSPVVHRIPPAAFRPLSGLLEYITPQPRPLVAWHRGIGRLALIEVRAADVLDPPVTLVPLVPPPPPPLPVVPSTSWIARIADRFRSSRRPERTKPVAKVQKQSSRVIPPAVRTSPDRDARRRQLEQAVVESPTPALWTELASVTADSGRPADAALCWVNALWECDPPPAEWLAEWVRAEARGKPGPRLAAALVAAIGFGPDPHPDADRLPELVRKVDAHEGELPVRVAWLARLGAARAAGGDPLSLARCRDRLLARLADEGPSLDLDAPGFLRFHGHPDGDRFRAAREWLLHAREPIHKWLQRLSTGLRLGAAGFDPPVRPTAAYADLMIAWGLCRLGEGTKADELAERAARVLEQAGGHGADAAVHHTLLARFQARIRDARHGRGRPPASTDIPVSVDDPDANYAVVKLAERSRILSPHPTGNPYGGQDLAPLLGGDDLGRRLSRLVREPSADAVTSLLAETAPDPTAATLPRVITVAAELPVTFAHRTADKLMLLLPRVVELLPEAVRLVSDPYTDPHAYLERLTARLVAAACRLATRYDLNGGFGAFVRFLLDATAVGDPVAKGATAAHLPEVFAALRKLGLTDLAGELAGAWAERPIGWFVMGRDDTGWAKLDAARERLFVGGIPDDRGRTAAAFEYVAALAHAPPRLALGRLEELFQRLDRVVTSGGTARFFALTPLELIDRAVTAVVTEEFHLGPAVRRRLEDDEFALRRRIARDLDAALTAEARGV